MQKNRKYNVYALYKGDTFIATGTLDEIANVTGLNKKTVLFYKSPTYKKRNRLGNCKVLVRMEE